MEEQIKEAEVVESVLQGPEPRVTEEEAFAISPAFKDALLKQLSKGFNIESDDSEIVYELYKTLKASLPIKLTITHGG